MVLFSVLSFLIKWLIYFEFQVIALDINLPVKQSFHILHEQVLSLTWSVTSIISSIDIHKLVGNPCSIHASQPQAGLSEGKPNRLTMLKLHVRLVLTSYIAHRGAIYLAICDIIDVLFGFTESDCPLELNENSKLHS